MNDTKNKFHKFLTKEIFNNIRGLFNKIDNSSNSINFSNKFNNLSQDSSQVELESIYQNNSDPQLSENVDLNDKSNSINNYDDLLTRLNNIKHNMENIEIYLSN